jgi:hypothetical protein
MASGKTGDILRGDLAVVFIKEVVASGMNDQCHFFITGPAPYF